MGEEVKDIISKEIVAFLRAHIANYDDRCLEALSKMYDTHCSLADADKDLYERMTDLTEDFFKSFFPPDELVYTD